MDSHQEHCIPRCCLLSGRRSRRFKKQKKNKAILDRGQSQPSDLTDSDQKSRTVTGRGRAAYEYYLEQRWGEGEVDDGRSSLLWECRQRDTVMHANVNISTPLKSIQMCLFRWKINKAVREKHSVLQNPPDNVISPSSLQPPQLHTSNSPLWEFFVHWSSVYLYNFVLHTWQWHSTTRLENCIWNGHYSAEYCISCAQFQQPFPWYSHLQSRGIQCNAFAKHGNDSALNQLWMCIWTDL